MNEIIAVGAISQVGAADPAMASLPLHASAPNALSNTPHVDGNFSSIIAHQLDRVDAKVAEADAMVTRFAIDDSTPIHQVTYALEEARLSVEIASQVRQRFVEGYRELMNMQL